MADRDSFVETHDGYQVAVVVAPDLLFPGPEPGTQTTAYGASIRVETPGGTPLARRAYQPTRADDRRPVWDATSLIRPDGSRSGGFRHEWANEAVYRRWLDRCIRRALAEAKRAEATRARQRAEWAAVDALAWSDAVRDLLTALGWTQRHLAEDVGCTVNAVQKWLAGDRAPTGLYADALRTRMERAGVWAPPLP